MTASSRLVVVAVALALAAGLAACGDDGDEASSEEHVDLVASLGFLGDDLGLSDREVTCVSADIREQVGDDGDLSGLADQFRQVDAGDVAVSELTDDADTILTGALSRCSGS